MTSHTRPVENQGGLGIRKEFGDLRRNVGSGKRRRRRTEFGHEPVEQKIRILLDQDRRPFSKRGLVFGIDQRLPSLFVESVEGVIVDPVTLSAVLANYLPDGTIGPIHLRSRC